MQLAIGMIPLLGIIGLAFDGARVYSVKSRLQQSIDSAGLAASQVAEEDREDTAIRYFNANYGHFLESALGTPRLSYNEAERELSLEVEATVPITFLRVLGFENMDVYASTKIKSDLNELEAALVLDVSTSMGHRGRINALRTASTDFVDSLFSERNNIPEIRISIIPYAGTVNIGTAYKSWTREKWPKWKGCVHDDMNSPDEDSAAAAGRFKTDFHHPQHPFYRWEDRKRQRRWTQIDRRRWSRRPNLAEQLAGLHIIIKKNPHAHPAEETRFCSSMKVKTLRSTRQALIRDLRNLNVTQQLNLGPLFRTTGTRTDTGLLWGWRTISPHWRGRWQGSGKIANYHEPGVTKAVILMTDGGNAAPVSKTLRGRRNDLDRRMLSVCRTMKERDGIMLYTIALEITNPDIKTKLRQCASSSAHYFESADRNTLGQAFQTIANQLTSLRITR